MLLSQGNMTMSTPQGQCPRCGTHLIVIDHPPDDAINAEAYDQLADATLKLTGRKLTPSEVVITWCDECQSTAYVGPQVHIEGTIDDISTKEDGD